MKHYVQLAAMLGNLCNSGEKMVKDDFYTMVMKNSDKNKGIRKEITLKTGFSNMPIFEFENEISQLNFINYLKTDFARFSLALSKNKLDLHMGELETVPYLDFTQEWDDEKLFKYFNVNEETQNYIRNYIPDYHGVRK